MDEWIDRWMNGCFQKRYSKKKKTGVTFDTGMLSPFLLVAGFT